VVFKPQLLKPLLFLADHKGVVGLKRVNAPAGQRGLLLLRRALDYKHLERRLSLQVAADVAAAAAAVSAWVDLGWGNEEQVGVEKEHHLAALES